jgi:hypothetical protein
VSIAQTPELDSLRRGREITSPETKGTPPRGSTLQERKEGGEQSAQKPEGGIEYGASDSSFMDLTTQQLFLYGNAFVRYQDFEVTSDFIILNFETNEVQASRRYLSAAKPTFSTGEQSVVADRLRYNMDTEKGIVYGARVKQNQLYIHGAITKFVKGESDSLHIDDVIYNRNAVITTCDHEDPHWGIRTSKLKLIPDKIAVIGPSNLELAGIPTPLVMPFAFAPLFSFNQGVSGLIFPQDPFYRSNNLGFGVRGLGYYLRFSEYMDLSVRGDIYTRGSWGLTTNTNYRRRYKYNGTLNLSFSRQLSEIQGQLEPNIQNSYSISLSHNQDSKAHPYRRIGGNLRFTVNDFDRRNFSDAQSQLNSQINSNFSYSYQFNKQLQFSAAVNHSQNTLNRSISFTIPNLQLRLNRIFPFKKGGSSGSNEKWFEKINFQYNGKLLNSVTTVDTLLFTAETLDAFRAGVTHEMQAGASYTLFNNFNFNTSVDYDELWYLQTHQLTQDSLGNDVSEIVPDFKPFRDVSISGGLSTNIAMR